MNRHFLLSRRTFVKYLGWLAAALSLEQSAIEELSQVLAKASKKPPLIWLKGQSCGGCTVSFLGASYPTPTEFILDLISLRYHDLLMLASGKEAEKELYEAILAGDYLLVVEGSVPASDERFCLSSEKPFSRLLEEASRNASYIIACGACASFGGIPKAGPTGSTGLSDFLKNNNIVNLPTCPVHPDHLVVTAAHFLFYGRMPELDELRRPKLFFKNRIHDTCERRFHFEKKEFLNDWNDPSQKDWCLYLKGCKGTVAFADCSLRKWNSSANWCVECGAGCQGCSEPGFYEKMSPLFVRSYEYPNADEIGAVVALAASAGIAAHFISRSLSTKRRKREDEDIGDQA